VASAAFAGGGLLILVSYGIRWLGTDPLVWRAGFWDEFLNFALTIIPLNLITLIGLGLSVRLDWQDRPVRRLWMWAVWLYVANTVFTLGYFHPSEYQADLGQLYRRRGIDRTRNVAWAPCHPRGDRSGCSGLCPAGSPQTL
jgi:hypothetical protein